MNRVLLTAVIILSLSLAGAIGCITAEPSSSPSQQSVQQPLPEPPKVFEKDISQVISTGFYRDLPEAREKQTLRFQLVTGNRVEGEVTSNNGDKILFALVRDPFGNIISQSAKYYSQGLGYSVSSQKYPWQFAFIAATTGEYTVEVNTGASVVMDKAIDAHIKVTAYDK